jgi:hypothetical protein
MTNTPINEFRAKCNVCPWIVPWSRDFNYIASFAKFHSVYFRNHDVSIMTEVLEVHTTTKKEKP